MEVLIVELLGQGPAESVEIRHVEIVLLAERGELVVVSDRVELVIEVREPLGWLFGDPLVVVKTEVVFALAVDETAIQICREQFWLYAAIDVDSKLCLACASRAGGRVPRQRVPGRRLALESKIASRR